MARHAPPSRCRGPCAVVQPGPRPRPRASSAQRGAGAATQPPPDPSRAIDHLFDMAMDGLPLPPLEEQASPSPQGATPASNAGEGADPQPAAAAAAAAASTSAATSRTSPAARKATLPWQTGGGAPPVRRIAVEAPPPARRSALLDPMQRTHREWQLLQQLVKQQAVEAAAAAAAAGESEALPAPTGTQRPEQQQQQLQAGSCSAAADEGSPEASAADGAGGATAAAEAPQRRRRQLQSPPAGSAHTPATAPPAASAAPPAAPGLGTLPFAPLAPLGTAAAAGAAAAGAPATPLARAGSRLKPPPSRGRERMAAAAATAAAASRHLAQTQSEGGSWGPLGAAPAPPAHCGGAFVPSTRRPRRERGPPQGAAAAAATADLETWPPHVADAVAEPFSGGGSSSSSSSSQQPGVPALSQRPPLDWPPDWSGEQPPGGGGGAGGGGGPPPPPSRQRGASAGAGREGDAHADVWAAVDGWDASAPGAGAWPDAAAPAPLDAAAAPEAAPPPVVRPLDSSTWAAAAHQLLPDLYDPSWHSTPYSLLFELWPLVASAHARARTRQLHHSLYPFVLGCAASADARVHAAAALSLVEALPHCDALLRPLCEHLPRAFLEDALLPLTARLQPPDVCAELEREVRRAHRGLAPSTALPPPLEDVLRRLERLRRIHPGVELPTLMHLLADEPHEGEGAGG